MNITHKILAVSAVILACAAVSGCSLIGYTLGGAMDGNDNYSMDSVAVCHRASGLPGEVAQAQNAERFASVMGEAKIGECAWAAVVTATDTLISDGLALDTVLVLRDEGSSHEGLLQGEPVSLAMNDSARTRVSGTVRRVKANYILLEVEGHPRGIPWKALNAIYLGDERVITAQDLSSPGFSRRLSPLPLVDLGQGTRLRYVPLRDVLLIRVARKINWGPARSILVGAGVAIDALMLVGMAEFASALSGLSSAASR